MASTAPSVLAGLAGAGVTAFAAAAAQSPETANLSPQATKPSCTVRLNVFAGDNAPVDERYIGTAYADKNNPKYDSKLFYGPAWAWSGITYTQTNAIGDKQPISTDVSFQAESNIHHWRMPDGKYHESKASIPALNQGLAFIASTEGVRYDAKFTNWTQSVEVSIDDPQKCLNVRRELLEKPLPPFSAQKLYNNDGAENANQFAARVWAKTGIPAWVDTTKIPNLSDEYKGIPSVIKLISREQRLNEDRASGQLKPESNIPPAWKP